MSKMECTTCPPRHLVLCPSETPIAGGRPGPVQGCRGALCGQGRVENHAAPLWEQLPSWRKGLRAWSFTWTLLCPRPQLCPPPQGAPQEASGSERHGCQAPSELLWLVEGDCVLGSFLSPGTRSRALLWFCLMVGTLSFSSQRTQWSGCLQWVSVLLTLPFGSYPFQDVCTLTGHRHELPAALACG